MDLNVCQVECGDKTWFVDPIRTYRRLCQAARGNPNDLIALYNSPDPISRSTGAEKLSEAASFAFEVGFDPTTGLGPTEDQVLSMLSQFLTWVVEKKKKEQ